MRSFNILFVSALALAASAMPAHAVGYSEGIDVDTASSDGNGNRIPYNLTVGTNIFTGTFTSPGDPGDVIPLFVDSGLTLTSVVITGLMSFSVSPGFIIFENISSPTPTIFSYTLGKTFPSINETVNAGNGFYSLYLGINGVHAGSYNVTFNVAGPPVTPPTPGVPEPASWAMMIGGLALTGLVLRHRKTAIRFA